MKEELIKRTLIEACEKALKFLVDHAPTGEHPEIKDKRTEAIDTIIFAIRDATVRTVVGQKERLE